MRFMLALIVLVSAASSAYAGPLNPPAGPVTPTPGPEPRTAINATNTPGDADSLYRISAPGSYYLTGNLTGVVGKSGIEVASDNVSIDLMGFTMGGVAGTEQGIVVAGVLQNIAIRNGTISGWSKSGVYGDQIRGGSITNIAATANGESGIFAGSHMTVGQCVAKNNTEAGIRCASACTITECVGTGNSEYGLIALFSCVVTRCTTTFNAQGGIAVTGTGNTVSECIASQNLGAGIFVNNPDNRIDSNNCTSNTRGIQVTSAGNIIVRNTCSGSTALNYDIVGANSVLVVFAPLSAAVSGDFGGTAPSTNPWANFAY